MLQRRADSAQRVDGGANGTLVLVAGLEGSGTTALATLLVDGLVNAIGLGEWTFPPVSTSAALQNFSSLSDVARQRHTIAASRLAVRSDQALFNLWHDGQRKYTHSGSEWRNRTLVAQSLDTVATSMRAALAASRVDRDSPPVIVMHFSMPFQDLRHTPFLFDIPALAHSLGPGWASRIAISLRDLPHKCQSRPRGVTGGHMCNQNAPYLRQIEALLNTSSDLRALLCNTPVAFVRYERLFGNDASSRASELMCLRRSLRLHRAFNMTQMLGSPQLQPRERLYHPLYNSSLRALEKWNTGWRQQFPFELFETSLQATSSHECV